MAEDFSQKTYLDQVFMIEKGILQKIVSSAGVKKTETVLEIGAGSGNLTKLLAQKAKKVIAIEIDQTLKAVLRKELGKSRNVEVLWGDALAILGRDLRFDRIVSNPPYSISEPLIKKLLGLRFRSAVLTLPWRFVERLTANPEERSYSKLSMFAHAFFMIETLMRVPQDAWTPRQDSDSVLIRLTPRVPKSAKDAFMRELMLQEDKKLKNAVREAIIRSSRSRNTKKKAKSAIEDSGFPEKLLEKKIGEMSRQEIESVVDKIGEILK